VRGSDATRGPRFRWPDEWRALFLHAKVKIE
jgi:hypothetical protein